MVPVRQIDQKRILPDVSGDFLKLERLEAGPAKERCVCRGELAEVLGEMLVPGIGMAFGGRKLVDGVLADDLMGGPVRFLAIRRLEREGGGDKGPTSKATIGGKMMGLTQYCVVICENGKTKRGEGTKDVRNNVFFFV